MPRLQPVVSIAIVVPALVTLGTTTASADVVLQDFQLTGNTFRMTMSGTLPTLVGTTTDQIRIRAEDSSDWMPSDTNKWVMSNESAFTVTNGSDVASVNRIDAQANSGDQIVIFFDKYFQTGGTVSGTVEFTLGDGYGDWDISPTTTFRISATWSSGFGVDLFTGVTAMSSNPAVPAPAGLAVLVGLAGVRRRRTR